MPSDGLAYSIEVLYNQLYNSYITMLLDTGSDTEEYEEELSGKFQAMLDQYILDI